MKSAPSMRLLAMAGPAARRQNLAIYNCSYLPADSIDSFVEALIISMAGCGVGFSVEGKNVEKFPRIKRQTGVKASKIVVDDSTEGWANSLREAMQIWFDGADVELDLSNLRPAGAPLKVKGGRASGPEPYRKMLEFVRGRVLARQGSFLRPIDAHDIMCAVGNAAVSGGVRRTAMISLFDWEDSEMRFAKHGDFERENSQRWNSNNSVVLPEGGLTQQEFMHLFMDMVDSGRGEPGIFSRSAARNLRPSRRQDGEFGTNPCGEIILRPYELCNLSIAIARRDDTYESLREKVEVATIIGTIQSMATKFPGLRDQWRRNCEEERLLGVDINGQLDSPVCWDRDVKERLLHEALMTNRETAKQLGIGPSVSVTCVKPSGNSSQLFNCSSGIHTRWSPYYIRNARVASHSPIYKVLRDAGVPMDPENGQTEENANTWVVHFPMKSPEGAITRKDRTAIQQCEFWLQNKLHWTEHNPSVTITYYPNETMDLIKWVWDHMDLVGGMTFLPAFDAQYAQMPYMEITKEEYEKLAENFPKVDFSKIYRYEEEDLTKAAQELACMGGACEVEFVPQSDGTVKMQASNGH
jgi:ribonucleoside-diphosphate reductase alpha chain